MTGLRTVVVHPDHAPDLVAARLEASSLELDGYTPVAFIGEDGSIEPVVDKAAWAARHRADLWLVDEAQRNWLRVTESGSCTLTTLLENGAGIVSTFGDDPPRPVERVFWPEGGWHLGAVEGLELVAEHEARVSECAAQEGAPVWACPLTGRAGAGVVDGWTRWMWVRITELAVRTAWVDHAGAHRMIGDPVLSGLRAAEREKSHRTWAAARLPPGALSSWPSAHARTPRRPLLPPPRALTREEAEAVLDRLAVAHPGSRFATAEARARILDLFYSDPTR